MGWVVYREGALYAQEYSFDETFEALVAHIVADFLTEFDPKRTLLDGGSRWAECGTHLLGKAPY